MPNPAAARLYAIALSTVRPFAFVAPLLSRLFLAYGFYVTGRGKLGNLDGVTSFFAGLGIPMPGLNAWFVSNLEYYGAMLLAVGLGTRVVSGMLSGSMVVALLTADRETFVEAVTMSGQADVTGVAPLVLLVPMVWLVLLGPGVLSLDALVARLLGLGPVGGAAAAPGPPAVSPGSASGPR